MALSMGGVASLCCHKPENSGVQPHVITNLVWLAVNMPVIQPPLQ